MHDILPLLLKDGYKVGHPFQYPDGTEFVYSNLTARQSRIPAINRVRSFGLQYFAMEYLQHRFAQHFFGRTESEVVDAYARIIGHYLGSVSVEHIRALHRLGYLPVHIKAVPEGMAVPLRVPLLTIVNTHPAFGWVTNMLETILSAVVWKPITAATIAGEYRRVFDHYAEKTVGGDDLSFAQWQGHDFSFRGLSGLEDATLVGAAHLTQFTGTDTIPALPFVERYYGADVTKELVGGSVPATEHSVMSAGGDDLATFSRLLTEVYPKGIVSVVSDTWDFWRVVTDVLPSLKDTIMARDGKLVIRPDSGDPVHILCGDPFESKDTPEGKGLIACLWDTFGGTYTPKGYRLLDAHVGAIYGDSITLERQRKILHYLEEEGYASFNVVLGIGSYTYQYVTRDTFGLAIKATWMQVNGEGRELWKSPKTDDGTKNSARGLLRVDRTPTGSLVLKERCTPEEEQGGVLQTVFKDGEVRSPITLAEVRANARSL